MFNEDDNSTTGRNVVHCYNEEIYTRFKVQHALLDTTIAIAIINICLVIFFLGIIENIVTMAKIVCDSRYHTPTFGVIGDLTWR